MTLSLTRIVRNAAAVALVPFIAVQGGFGWGHFGHEMINQLAAEKLPQDVPEFLRSPEAVVAMTYYAPQPDRWRSAANAVKDTTLDPEHFIDMEWADQVGGPLPRHRYDFLRMLDAAEQAKTHPEIKFTPENIGLLPWAGYDEWQRLTQAMREYRFEQSSHRDTRPIEREIVVFAGTLGHWVGDGSQPLHLTMEFNGWTGPNPKGYEGKGIHGRFESDFLNANVKPERDIAPLMTSEPKVIADVFADFVAYLRKSNSYVEQVYAIDKVHGFDGPGSPEAKALVDERLAAGATKLRDLIYTAWVDSGTPLPRYQATTPAATAAPAGK